MSWLQRSYRIGFVIAGLAAMVFAVAGGEISTGGARLGSMPMREASLAMLISGVTCLVTTSGSFSAMLLAWRLDRRQS